MKLEEIGLKLCQNLKNRNYSNIAKEFGYAIAFEKPIEIAIKEDFENALQASKCDLNSLICEISIKQFHQDQSEFLHLIECILKPVQAKSRILIEVIQNKSGFYLEQISYVV